MASRKRRLINQERQAAETLRLERQTPMTRDEAIAEVERRRAADPDVSWIASQRNGDWVGVRIGVTPIKVTGTATKPPPLAPQGDPHSAVERAAWFAANSG